ncbi:MAG: arsenic resistance protein [Pseudomonadota bacterium]
MPSPPAQATRETETDTAPVSVAGLFAAAILAGAGLGLAAPAAGDLLSHGTDATLLVLICLLFFELRLGAVIHASGQFHFLALAWAANFVIVPVIGFAVASLVLFREPILFAGLMIYFLAPCTDWFLGFTRMARGDTELGAALIPVNLITQLLLFPLWLWLLTRHSGFLDVATFPQTLLQWFLLPLVAAQTLRICLEKLLPQEGFARLLDWMGRLVPLALAALIAQIFAANVGVIAAHGEVFALVALAVCLFFVAIFFISGGLARLGHLAYPQRALLGMTMAARNAPLMLALTAAAIPDQPLILAAIVLGMLIEIPYLTALKQLLLRRRKAG